MNHALVRVDAVRNGVKDFSPKFAMLAYVTNTMVVHSLGGAGRKQRSGSFIDMPKANPGKGKKKDAGAYASPGPGFGDQSSVAKRCSKKMTGSADW